MNINRPLMSEKLQISVIIPVYNAGPYVRKAVESALEQPETAEVILIEDGSPDNSLEVCRELEKEYEKVRLFTHPNNENLGAGPTRNVGIENAKFDYIAFLDADDFFLPDRFRAERRIFKEHPDADGVYGAAGFHYYEISGRKEYGTTGLDGIFGVTSYIDPDHLPETLLGIKPTAGVFSIITLTCRNIEKVKRVRFSGLELHQDSEYIYKVALKCRLYPGEISSPVVMIGVHDRNRYTADRPKSPKGLVLYANLLDWAEKEQIDRKYITAIQNHLLIERIKLSTPLKGLLYYSKGMMTSQLFRSRSVFFYGGLNYALNGFPSRTLNWFRNKYGYR